MLKEQISQEELTNERTPSELWDWLNSKVKQLCSTKEGLRDFRLQKGLIKQLVEEVAPLAIFGKNKFNDIDQVLLQPVIGNQNFDAIIIDRRTTPDSITHIEITQAHEGEDDYWRRCKLLKNGYVSSNAPVIKKSQGKKFTVSIPPETTSVEEGIKNTLHRILDAIKRKANKDYPLNHLFKGW